MGKKNVAGDIEKELIDAGRLSVEQDIEIYGISSMLGSAGSICC